MQTISSFADGVRRWRENMSNVRRVYVEKKPAFAVRARDLEAEIRNYLGISDVKGVRELIRYDMEHVSEETYRKALVTVFPSRRWTMCTRKILS